MSAETNKYWSDSLKELERLADKGLINKSDITPFLCELMDVSDRYKQALETNLTELTNKSMIKAENEQLEKAIESVKQLQGELMACNHFTSPTIAPLINALNIFVESTPDNKPGKGKQVKLSKHKLFRVFEILFYRYTNNAEINESYLLANEFMSAAGYEPESSNRKDLKLRKQNFDEAREALEIAGISDSDLFYILA